MSLDACASLVERGDPDRWLTVMAAPVEARRRLLPIYAFNVEVSRAPWVTAEPMIAEIRLQWWADALEEIGSGGTVRRHEVMTELAEVLDETGAALLGRLVEARRHDVWTAPFEDTAALKAYLDATGAGLMWTAARSLGAPAEAELPVSAYGRAAAAANWLNAAPALIAAGRQPLPGEATTTAGDLARWGLEQAAEARQQRRRVPGRAHPALLSGWMTEPVLERAAADPGSVMEGRLQSSEARRKFRLIRLRYGGGW